MKKREFLVELRRRLRGIPKNELEESIKFYEEAIDDRVEDGLSEKEAVNALGSMDDIVDEIMSNTSLSKIIRGRIDNRKEKSGNGPMILFLILGFPLWFPLLITFIAVAFSFYVVLLSLFFSLYVVIFALGISGIALVGGSIIVLISNGPASALTVLGCGLFLIGLIGAFYPTIKAGLYGFVKITKGFFLVIKKIFMIGGKNND